MEEVWFIKRVLRRREQCELSFGVMHWGNSAVASQDTGGIQQTSESPSVIPAHPPSFLRTRESIGGPTWNSPSRLRVVPRQRGSLRASLGTRARVAEVSECGDYSQGQWLAWDQESLRVEAGAEGGIRTRTSRSSQPPEDCVSTNFTTSARLVAEAGFEPAAKGL